MPLVPAICTSCGATLSVDHEKEAAICPYCGTPYVVAKAISFFQNRYNISANVVNVYNIGTNRHEEGNKASETRAWLNQLKSDYNGLTKLCDINNLYKYAQGIQCDSTNRELAKQIFTQYCDDFRSGNLPEQEIIFNPPSCLKEISDLNEKSLNLGCLKKLFDEGEENAEYFCSKYSQLLELSLSKSDTKIMFYLHFLKLSIVDNYEERIKHLSGGQLPKYMVGCYIVKYDSDGGMYGIRVRKPIDKQWIDELFITIEDRLRRNICPYGFVYVSHRAKSKPSSDCYNCSLRCQVRHFKKKKV